MGVRAGKLPHDRVRHPRDKRPARRRDPPHPQTGARADRRRVISSIANAADPRKFCEIPAEELRLKPESLCRDIERRQIERLQLRLIIARVQPRQFDRSTEINPDSPLAVVRQPRAVVTHFDIGQIPIPFPVLPAAMPVHALHQAVRVRIIRRHRRAVRIGRVIQAGTRINPDPIPRKLVLRIGSRSLDNSISGDIRLLAVVPPMATAHRQTRQPRESTFQNQPDAPARADRSMSPIPSLARRASFSRPNQL